MKRLFALFAGLVISANPLSRAEATKAPESFAAVRDFISQSVLEGRAPSVSVAMVKDDRLIWAEGFGYADLEAKRPATPDSIYLLASVSKPITATGLMVLVDRGQIDLDKPANDYLPAAKLRASRGSARDMTVRRLANHTSGMQVHYNFYFDNVEPMSDEEVILRYGTAHVEPGRRVEYCNLAFGVLDYITEVVGKMPWTDFMVRNIYDVIGMTSTSDRVRSGLENRATAQYQLDMAGHFIRVPPYRFDHDGASAVWSSANDLSRFLRLHLNGGVVDGKHLLKQETARAMLQATGVRDPNQPDQGFGVAWSMTSHLGHRCFEHSGGMPGVATWVRGFPDDNAGFVVLINASGGNLLGQICQRLTRALFPDASEVAAERTAPKVEESKDAFIGAWQGTLAHFDGDIAVVLKVKDDGMVRVKLGKRETTNLTEVAFRNERLSGQTRGLLKTQAGFHGPVTLEFNLERAGEELAGFAVAKADGYFALSHGVRLSKQPSGANSSVKSD